VSYIVEAVIACSYCKCPLAITAVRQSFDVPFDNASQMLAVTDRSFRSKPRDTTWDLATNGQHDGSSGGSLGHAARAGLGSTRISSSVTAHPVHVLAAGRGKGLPFGVVGKETVKTCVVKGHQPD
jgi:hypothetical protein